MAKRTEYKKIILNLVKNAGRLALDIVAPNAFKFVSTFPKNKRKKLKYYINQKAEQLVAEGFLEIVEENDTQFLQLTKKGGEKLLYYQITTTKKPGRWDGKWRVVIFDVWEKTRVKRNLLREEIKNFGFIQLQRSVWIYPYECGQFIELLKTDLSFGKNIRYMVVESLDFDENLKRRFKLSG
ncbi:hypothetical protein A3I95_03565 [Candidatus Nomurabacteria bacterium RIFCSPLOWO2_02_FULL_44_12]|uniref:Transcriptional repressor PaaX-like central Cas2-like domain-containing protein n=1 Tax=Candidatus Nomurabacteria bacterium RIFCSPLOWO2_12_FULL_44_11 TaxID=1801796 RepID=A0A1F6Y822_9BACT|nr:MAG: hypothetical protein A3E95_02600 [Candidatus Nomurabacteria bacterium RIFCSPHIGHO2_12_FULL_44_22b]OGJ02496.1 MAG: hypothetical protein A3G53_01205 [Candidatus Nomurabacteria bacterium RIFCSPLOWO2_12_FULL_44_11]OGJ06886.1 MAG: hypothetical protein A3I95_03565 [Candidatus Nomurabacteria bacterium RIFCSPLOWO2_02_FULL_44_12]